MTTIAIMCVGILVGATVFPAKLKKWNDRLQLGLTALLIFTMGVGLGSRPGFLEEMGSLGLESVLFAAVPMALSTAVVYPLSRRLLERKSGEGEPQTAGSREGEG